MLGDNAPVLLPPACFLRDADISQKLLWEGMTIVQPWDMDDIAPEVPSTSRPFHPGICTDHLWLANPRLEVDDSATLEHTMFSAGSHTPAGDCTNGTCLACTLRS